MWGTADNVFSYARMVEPFLENYDALVMLFGAAFLLLHGPGSLSLDDWLSRRRGV